MNTTTRIRIEQRAEAMKAAGCNWPTMDEFVALYGAQGTDADCDDYLSTFDPATAPKLVGNTCSYDNPSPEAALAAKAARRAAGNSGDEDTRLAAAESTWRDYLPPCWCNKCVTGEDASAPPHDAHTGATAMKIRLHTIDTATGDECTIDVDVEQITAQAIAAALAEWSANEDGAPAGDYEGLFVQEGGPDSDQPGSGAFVVRHTNDVFFGEYLIAGCYYTVFS